MRSVVIVTEDKAGLLSDISYILSKSGVVISGIDLDVVGGKAILSLSVKDPGRAKGVLERNGFKIVEPKALVIKISHSLRSFADVMRMLEKKKVRIEDYSEITSDDNGGVFALMVNKRRKASRLLENFMIGAAVPA